MSKEGMEKFFKFMAEDKACQEKVKGFGDDLDGLAAYARELGYEFTAEELRDFQDKARELLKSKVAKFRPPDAAKSPGERAFYDLMKLAETDETVAKELDAVDMSSLETVIAYGKEKGFIFTAQDMKAVGKDILGQEDELSDEELEAAAGGIILASIIGVVYLAVACVGAFAVAAGIVGVAVAVSEQF